jgi:hypothetical protein
MHYFGGKHFGVKFESKEIVFQLIEFLKQCDKLTVHELFMSSWKSGKNEEFCL